MEHPPMEEMREATWGAGDDLEQVFRHSDASWRHGTRETVVFKRKSDNTYWEAKYRLSTDQECDELREGTADITQVTPRETVTIVYDKVIDPKKDR